MALIVLSNEMCFMRVHSFSLILVCLALLFFLSCFCYKLLIIRLMKAASIDGPSGLPTACPMFNIEMLYCEFVVWGQIKCLFACLVLYCTVKWYNN